MHTHVRAAAIGTAERAGSVHVDESAAVGRTERGRKIRGER